MDHTILTDFKPLDQWGDLVTLQERRFYLRRLVLHDSNYKIRAAKFAPGGYDRDTSDLFLVNTSATQALISYQLKVLDKISSLPDNISFQSEEWQILQGNILSMSKEFKIHLQPQEEHIPLIISRLVSLILADELLQSAIAAFKCRIFFHKDRPNNKRAIIVIYLSRSETRKQARLTCKQLLFKLKEGLAQYEFSASNNLPIYNYPITKLISFIQMGTDVKFHLKRILGDQKFNRLFPSEFYHALLMDEKVEYYLEA